MTYVEVKSLEAKRDAVRIENEELVTNYYRIRQQLQRTEKEMQVGGARNHMTTNHMLITCTLEPPKTDSPYYGNLHNADKSLWSRIIPYTIVYMY